MGATYAAQPGATAKVLMVRFGETTPRMAMKYQMASQARDEEITKQMSELAGGARDFWKSSSPPPGEGSASHRTYTSLAS
ncbi:hypothetical protein ACGFK1_25230 [Mycobacterium sp. NPDC048908]|uniref:hypothetical protein n=1 Tax=Mycobacterium sp. NPDC048908 TaxID=3364292 RepID=UPI00372493C8